LAGLYASLDHVYVQGFILSTESFTNILAKFTSTQKTLTLLQDNMQNSKRLLTGSSQKQNLRLFYFESMMYSKVLTIIDKIEYVLSVPRLLDGFLRRKQYLHAVHVVRLVIFASHTPPSLPPL
jgi:hypothetical protein